MDAVRSSPLRLSRVAVGVCLLSAFALANNACLNAEQRQHKPHKESKRADTREIEAMEAQWRDAMVKGDSASLDKLLAEDFFGISSNGTVSDKQQYIHRMVASQNRFKSIDLMDIKVRMQPTTAIAVSQARVIGELDGRPLVGIFRYTKVYGRDPNGWHVLNFEATRVSGPHADEPDMRQGMPLSPVSPAPSANYIPSQ